jgi:hypothetical protein
MAPAGGAGDVGFIAVAVAGVAHDAEVEDLPEVQTVPGRIFASRNSRIWRLISGGA